MDVTVAICTWNRARLLDRTLDRLRTLRVPAGVAWELLVVDNKCTDDTPAVLARHAEALPLRPLREPRQGHSHARNRAVAEARGRLVLWTDDDVLTDPNWLAEHLAAADRFPDAAFLGGPVRPWFERRPPRWVARHLGRVGFAWALIDHGPDVRPLKPGEYAFGANLAFRAEVLRRHPFDPDFGRVGDRLTSGDECRVIDAIRAAGGTGVWVGTAPVGHFLPADRLTVRYVTEVARWAGYHGHGPFADDRSRRLCGAPRWLWKRYLTAAATARLLAPTKGDRWLTAVLDAARWRGLIDRFRAERATRR